MVKEKLTNYDSIAIIIDYVVWFGNVVASYVKWQDLYGCVQLFRANIVWKPHIAISINCSDGEFFWQ